LLGDVYVEEPAGPDNPSVLILASLKTSGAGLKGDTPTKVLIG
jgi:hypothetical protein